MPRHVQKNMELKEAERHTLTSVETRHAGNLRLAAVLLHPLLRNEAISQHRAAGKETAQMADSPLMDAGFSGFLSSKIGPSFSEAEVKDEGFGLLIGKFAVQN